MGLKEKLKEWLKKREIEKAKKKALEEAYKKLVERELVKARIKAIKEAAKKEAKKRAKEEARKHLMQWHRVPSSEVMAYIEEETMTVGYLLEIERLDEIVKREGVRPERFWDRVERFGALVHEDRETPRVVEREGKKYLVIDPAWVRIVARTRIRERELIRGLERSR